MATRGNLHRPQGRKIVRDALGRLLGFNVNKIRAFLRVLTNPDRARTIIQYAIAHYTGHRHYKKFIIVGRSRTGSTFLQSMLNAHPEVHAKSEVLTRTYGTPVKNVLQDVFSRQPSAIKALGFKMFYDHPLDCDGGAYWQGLAEMEDLHVIHLKRHNILRALISEKIARKTAVWGVKSERGQVDSQRKLVSFSVEELRAAFEWTKRAEERSELLFAGHPSVTIQYEALIDHPQRELQRVTDMLGLEHHNPVSRLRKQNREKLSDLLQDYTTIKKAFQGTEWQGYFDE